MLQEGWPAIAEDVASADSFCTDGTLVEAQPHHLIDALSLLA